MTKFDPGHRVLARIHHKNNTSKGECYFLGFIEGVISNKRVDQTELEPLLAECEAFCQNFNDDDAREILVEAEQDHVDTVSELLDLLSCISDIRLKKIDETCPISSANRLLGFCAGVACDGIITLNETRALLERLNAPTDLDEDPRIKALRNLCEEALEDDLIEKDEEREIADCISRLVGDSYGDTGITVFGAAPVIEHEASVPITFAEGDIFVLTGKFDTCSRREFGAFLSSSGMVEAKTLTMKSKYLIVGSEAARDWRFASLGRKMQKAFQMKEKGHPIQIISENHVRPLIEHLL